jgi:hypothetical protein
MKTLFKLIARPVVALVVAWSRAHRLPVAE